MSKFDEEKLYKLRHNLEVELPEVIIYTDFEGTYIRIVYDGKSVCKIRTDGNSYGYKVTFTSEFSVNGHETTQWFPGHRSITKSIRIAIQKYEKGQKNMSKLEELRDYLYKEIGNAVTVIYDRAIGPHNDRDRIRIKRNDLVVCSVYNTKTSLFNVIFYDPYICRSEGYSGVINITLEEVPKAIDNRINICEDMNDKNIFVSSDSMVDKVLSQCKGGFTYARSDGRDFRHMYPIMRTGIINITVDSFIKDVIFNDPATIVLWVDGSKTVVKCQPGETFDPEKGLAMAISKRVLGNDYGYYETFAKHVGRYNKRSRKKYIKAIDDVLNEIAPDEIVHNGVVYKRVEEK